MVGFQDLVVDFYYYPAWERGDVSRYFHRFSDNFHDGRILELGLSLLIGLLLGALVISFPYLPVSSDFQKLILVIPFAFTLAILFNNPERLILFTLAIAVPLNLDISLIISPYARIAQNMANGRTIVALTELRLSLVLIIVAFGYILWLVERRGINRSPVHFFAKTSIPALGLIFISILSVTQSQDKQLSLFKIAQLVELFLIFFYLANHLRTKQDLQFFIIVLMGGMLAESILMVIQWRTGWGFSIAGITASISSNDLRTAGTLGTANSAGVIIAAYLTIVFAMVWLFIKRSQKVFGYYLFCVRYYCTDKYRWTGSMGWFRSCYFCFYFFRDTSWLDAYEISSVVVITNDGNWCYFLQTDLHSFDCK